MNEARAYEAALDACASEPIHRLGRTQAFGVLLAFDDQRRIVLASANGADWTGRPPARLLGMPADRVLPGADVDAAVAHARLARQQRAAQHLFQVRWPGRDEPVDVTIHGAGPLVVVEAEASGETPGDGARAIEQATREIGQAETVAALADSAVRAVSRLTGYDRVMVYRFGADDSGTVIAEQHAAGMPPYLGLRFPASDIPAQARELYRRSPIRVIADASDDGAPLASLGGPEPDLSLATLRSVSPVHLQYMRNMGSAASMSISLVVDGRLWGLIACHHRTPMRPLLAVRTLAELLGRLYALALGRIERRLFETDVESLMLKAPGVEPLLDPAAPPGLREAAAAAIGRLFGLSGLVMQVDGVTWGWGTPPSEADTLGIVAALAEAPNRAPLAAHDSLATWQPPLRRLAPGAAGVLALSLSASWSDWMLLFRDEVERHVVWAGEPAKAIDPADGRLTPRASFEAWREAVHFHAEPWTRVELDLAENLRVRLLEVLLAHREQRELELIRRTARQQALLVGELNHRVRNMLGLISGLVQQTARGSATIEQLAERLEDRVQALSRAYGQVERARWQPASLGGLIAAELDAFGDATQIGVSGQPVDLEPNAYLSLALVVHELATNARKHGALSVPDGRVSIDWTFDAGTGLALRWTERGGPPVQPPRHNGFGTRVITQGLAHQLGGSTQVDFEPEGIVARLTLPRGAAPGLPSVAPPVAAPDRPDRRHALPQRVLVVEDDLVIAFLAETLLHRIGCPHAVVSGTAEDALALLRTQRFDFALLDVNLGDHSSEAVALRLAEIEVPVLLATGYSESDRLPAGLTGLPRLGKPYTEDDLRRAIESLA